MTLNGLTISESWIRKDVERSGCGLIWGTIPAFVWVTKENWKTCQDGWSSGNGMNNMPSEHEVGPT
jgi:hypothetical protein